MNTILDYLDEHILIIAIAMMAIPFAALAVVMLTNNSDWLWNSGVCG